MSNNSYEMVLLQNTVQCSHRRILLDGLNSRSTNEFLKWVPQMYCFFLFVFYIYYDLCTIRANLHFVFIISRSLVFQLLCSQVFIVSFPLFLFTRCMNPLLSECMVQMKANFRCDVYVTHCWYDGAKMICESNCWMIFIIMNFFFFFFYRIFFLNILKRF